MAAAAHVPIVDLDDDDDDLTVAAFSSPPSSRKRSYGVASASTPDSFPRRLLAISCTVPSPPQEAAASDGSPHLS